jgi:hypothetical protein
MAGGGSRENKALETSWPLTQFLERISAHFLLAVAVVFWPHLSQFLQCTAMEEDACAATITIQISRRAGGQNDMENILNLR